VNARRARRFDGANGSFPGGGEECFTPPQHERNDRFTAGSYRGAAMPFRFPVALELTGRRCVVIGGGPEAERKARSLLEAGAGVTVVAETTTAGLAGLARRGDLTHLRRPYRRGDLDGAFLVMAATDDPATTAAVFAEAETGRVLCNSVDDTAHCHFAVPSIVRRGELVLAISTGGRAPALAKRLRRRLTAAIGWEYAALVDILGDVRAETLPRRPPDFGEWARRWAELLDGEDELIGLVAEGRLDELRARLRAHLEGRVPAPAS
jgi:precorrin-2 dehydrogenase / sirohydrochlorin ferrochelatase